MDKTPVLTTCWTIKKWQNVEINRDKWISSFDKKKKRIKSTNAPKSCLNNVEWWDGLAEVILVVVERLQV